VETVNARAVAQCDGKESFETNAQAIRVRDKIRRRGSTKRRLDTYRCVYCGGWHIGGDEFRRRKDR